MSLQPNHRGELVLWILDYKKTKHGKFFCLSIYKTSLGFTPLMYAADECQRCLEVLLNFNASVDAKVRFIQRTIPGKFS